MADTYTEEEAQRDRWGQKWLLPKIAPYMSGKGSPSPYIYGQGYVDPNTGKGITERLYTNPLLETIYEEMIGGAQARGGNFDPRSLEERTLSPEPPNYPTKEPFMPPGKWGTSSVEAYITDADQREDYDKMLRGELTETETGEFLAKNPDIEQFLRKWAVETKDRGLLRSLASVNRSVRKAKENLAQQREGGKLTNADLRNAVLSNSDVTQQAFDRAQQREGGKLTDVDLRNAEISGFANGGYVQQSGIMKNLNQPSSFSNYLQALNTAPTNYNVGIGAIPGMKSGGFWDRTGSVMSGLGTGAGIMTKLGMAIPNPITWGLGLGGMLASWFGAPKGISTRERAVRAAVPGGKYIPPGLYGAGGDESGEPPGKGRPGIWSPQVQDMMKSGRGYRGQDIDVTALKNPDLDEQQLNQLIGQFIAQQNRNIAAEAGRRATTQDQGGSAPPPASTDDFFTSDFGFTPEEMEMEGIV